MNTPFNFDEMADLYKRDPAKFELVRKQMIDDEINKAPVEQRDALRATMHIADLMRTDDTMNSAMLAFKLMNRKTQELITNVKRLATFVN